MTPTRIRQLLTGLATAAAVAGPLLRVRSDSPAEQAVGSPAALTLRQGCAWGQPGRQPYRGTTEQALTAAGLPPEVVQQIAAQRQAGQKSSRLEIRRNAIRQLDGPRTFNPRSMAMSFGLTLCLHSWVNFVPGHVEPADLYEAHDATGRLHSVMVPDVCGNLTVLGVRVPSGVVAGVAGVVGALAARSEALAAAAEALVSAVDPEDADPGAAARSAFGPGSALEGGAAIGAGAFPAGRAVGGTGALVSVAYGGGADRAAAR